MIDVIWDLYQQQQIGRAGERADSARQAATDLESRVRELEARLDRACLVTQSLWELLKEQTGLTEERLLKKFKEVDLRDGRLDQRMGRAGPVDCPKCLRTVSTKHLRCLYCDTELPGANPLL
jgi:hypothetical protein